jgi:biopolymer transport protein ExbB
MGSAWDGLFGAGGPIIAILAVLSLISIAIIIVKLLQLRGVLSGGALRDAALALWSDGNRDDAARSLSTGQAPADRVTSWAMGALAQGIDRDALEAETERRGNEELERMGRLLRVLEVIAMVSPLLGLLGTVLGMIQSFQELEMAQGSANASVLAGGIWQALLTTAAGLIVAIPAAIGANLLAARVERAGFLIENTIGRLDLIEYGKGRSGKGE